MSMEESDSITIATGQESAASFCWAESLKKKKKSHDPPLLLHVA